MRVFWMAAGSYLVGYLVLALSYWMGMVEAHALAYLALPFLLPNIVFYVMFRVEVRGLFMNNPGQAFLTTF